MNKRTLITALISVISLSLFTRPVPAAGSTVARPAKEVAEEIVEYFVKRGSRETAEELAEYGGKSAVRELTERVVRETGEEGLEKVVKLSKRHGVKALRTLDNVEDMAPVLRVVDNLGDDATKVALRRLGSSSGSTLARMTKKFGKEAMEAEIKHPGVGMRLVKNFGDDGARLALKSSDDAAMTIARHADDIAKLPASQRRGIKNLLFSQTDRMVKFMGRFVENNPGKVLFTGATAGVILAEADRVLGGEMKAITGPDGEVQIVETKGLAGRTVERGTESVENITSQILTYLLPVIALGAIGWLAIKLHSYRKICRMKENAEKTRLEREMEDRK